MTDEKINLFDQMRESLRNHDVFISEDALQKLFAEIEKDFKSRQTLAGQVAYVAFDKILNHDLERLHSGLLLNRIVCDKFLQNVGRGNASIKLTLKKVEALKKLIEKILDDLTLSIIFSNVFIYLMLEKEQAAKEKPENLAG